MNNEKGELQGSQDQVVSTRGGSKEDPGGLQGFWDRRLKDFSLRGIGFMDMSERFNSLIWRCKERAISRALQEGKIEVGGRKVLDVGTGIGYWLDFYLRTGASGAVGVEISEVAVTKLRHKYAQQGQIRIVHADATDADFPSHMWEGFDIVNVLDVAYHVVRDEDFERLIRNLCQALRVGGVLLLTDCFRAPGRSPAYLHKFRGLADYVPTMERYGVHLVRVFPVFHILGPPFAVRNSYFRNMLRYGLMGSWLLAEHLPSLFSWMYSIDSITTRLEGFRPSISLMVARKSDRVGSPYSPSTPPMTQIDTYAACRDQFHDDDLRVISPTTAELSRDVIP